MEELFKERKEKLNLFKSFRNKLQDKKGLMCQMVYILNVIHVENQF